MSGVAPWTQAEWKAAAVARLERALAEAGRPCAGSVRTEKEWARSWVLVAPTDAGDVWVKHSYGLPPGEEKVLEKLAPRWADRLPGLVAVWQGAMGMEPLPGQELAEDGPLEDWVATATALAELEAGEESHVDEWLALGVRDRRAAAWERDVRLLLESPTLGGLDASIRSSFESLVPEFIARYQDAFQAPATLVHQDSGCCNVHITERGPVFFDWADVVIGHATFSCDRLLDQTPPDYHEKTIQSFIKPLSFSVDEFRAMRRSNVLHEVLRYHDELTYIAADDPAHASLSKSVCSQIRVLVEHELRRSS